MNKLILLDYDGTLVKYESLPSKATPSARLLNLLDKLIHLPETTVILITGRDHSYIDNYLGHLPITIIAEHGAMVKENNSWRKLVPCNDQWKKRVLGILNLVTSSCPGSFIEEKQYSVAWHYRNSEEKQAYLCSKALIHLLEEEEIIPSYNLKVVDGNKVLEIISKNVGKGKVIKNILNKGGYDHILAIGNDTTDEEIFEFLLNNHSADTFKVGNRPSFAKQKLKNVTNVIELLEQLPP
jgi:trehalose 6-phosphate synthase/phosphatase